MTPENVPRDELEAVVSALAVTHYVRGYSSLRVNQLRERMDADLSAGEMRRALEYLHNEGAIETIGDGGRTRWRLAGAERVAPYYAEEAE